jgi:outer membrane protein TolC
MTANPSVLAASYGVDVAQLEVKIAESALYPTVKLIGNAGYLHDVPFTGVEPRQSSATALMTVSIPLYQGGAEYSGVPNPKKRWHNADSTSPPRAIMRELLWFRCGVRSRPSRRSCKPRRSR